MRLSRIIATLLAAGAIAAAPLATVAQEARKVEPQKIQFMEAIHSLFYTPLYVAHGKGYFKEQGLDFALVAAQGSDKATAALLSGSADVVLAGPETAIYIANGQSPEKVKIFAGLTATDGSFLVGRNKPENFSWEALKGKTILGWRAGSAPALFLDKALRAHGIDPKTDVTIITNVAIPARLGAFMAGTGDFATFFEPDVSLIEGRGQGFSLANVGMAVGQIDYTAFTTTDRFIRENPQAIQAFANAIAKAQAWVASAPAADIGKVLVPYFPGVSEQILTESVERHRKAGLWKKTPVVTPEAIAALQELLISSGVLAKDKVVAFDRVVADQFANAAQ